eukprot:1160387-Pelagomonas_calceolata.AAC.4
MHKLGPNNCHLHMLRRQSLLPAAVPHSALAVITACTLYTGSHCCLHIVHQQPSLPGQAAVPCLRQFSSQLTLPCCTPVAS